MLRPELAQNLAREVLLNVDADIDAVSDASANIWSEPDPQLEPERQPAERIGNCTVIGRIESGGMGTVYEALQDFPRKRVALKVIRPGIFSPAALRRFRHEAEILGQLEHPGIAAVFRAGTHDDGHGGVPFIVMEFVPNAAPITDFANRNDLNDRQRLNLFIEACDAVHFAHLKGVIHRDLKPGNILVGHEDGAEPRVKIIDFGIARATNTDLTISTLHTHTSEVLGTVAYMSPEQTRGKSSDLDSRSDVYSLGVVLYELLCGRLPYDLTDTATPNALRIIETHDPARPSTVRKRLRGDLECILLKALEKDASRRYQSAAELAQDIRRHLKGEPIEARRPSVLRQTWAYMARHPIQTTAAACVSVVIISYVSGRIAVQWSLHAPARFSEISSDETFCALLSRAGGQLEVLGGHKHSLVQFAETLKSPATGQMLALYSVNGRQGSNLTGGQMYVAPLDDIHRPIWTTDPQLPVPWPYRSDLHSFTAQTLVIADVFKDDAHSGPELIVVHGGAESPWCVRVYNLDKDVLLEAWHVGMISSVAWDEPNGLIVCTADRHRIHLDRFNEWIEEHEPLSNMEWLRAFDKFAAEPLRKPDYPEIVFALRPKPAKFLRYVSDQKDEEAQRAVHWYKCMRPLRLSRKNADSFEPIVENDYAVLRPSVIVNLECNRSISPAIISIRLDELGNPGETRRSDVYEGYELQGFLPPYTSVTLGDLPPGIAMTIDEIAQWLDAQGALSPDPKPY